MILTTEELLKLNPNAFKEASRKAESDEKRNEWLKSRAGRITASGVHKLFTSKYETANNKTSRNYLNERVAQAIGSRLPQFSTAATRWGNDHELEAAEAYIERTGNEVTKYGDNQEFVKMGKRAGATPDGLVFADGTLQIKCPYNPANHVEFLLTTTQDEFKKKFPEYYLQTQMEMLVTQRYWCDFVSYDPRIESDLKLHIIRLKRDDAVLRVMVAHLVNKEEEIEEKVNLVTIGF